MLLDGQYTWDIEGSDYFNLTYYNTWSTTTVGRFIHNIAKNSKQYINVATDKQNEVGNELVAYSLLGCSVIETSGVLYKFAKEVGMI